MPYKKKKKTKEHLLNVIANCLLAILTLMPKFYVNFPKIEASLLALLTKYPPQGAIPFRKKEKRKTSDPYSGSTLRTIFMSS